MRTRFKPFLSIPTLPLAVLFLAGCASQPAPQLPQTRSFNLEISQPSPYANYVQVAPSRGAELPPPEEIITQDFSRYLRRATGCVFDVSRPAAAIGNKQVPAGYMVPVSCP